MKLGEDRDGQELGQQQKWCRSSSNCPLNREIIINLPVGFFFFSEMQIGVWIPVWLQQLYPKVSHFLKSKNNSPQPPSALSPYSCPYKCESIFGEWFCNQKGTERAHLCVLQRYLLSAFSLSPTSLYRQTDKSKQIALSSLWWNIPKRTYKEKDNQSCFGDHLLYVMSKYAYKSSKAILIFRKSSFQGRGGGQRQSRINKPLVVEGTILSLPLCFLTPNQLLHQCGFSP